MKAKRNRIVIDLNQPPPPGSRWRRGKKRSGRVGRILALIGIFLLLVVVAIAAGGYFWWQHFKGQPAYTLALVVDAAQRNDKDELNRLLDMDKIAASFVSDVRITLTGSAILNNVAPAQVDQMTANLTPKLKESLQEVLPPEIQRVTERAKGKPFVFVAVTAPYFANIKKNGASAAVDFKFKDEQIQLTMDQTEQAWRITAIKDNRLTNIIADAAKKDTSQRGQQFQDEVSRRLKELQTPTPSPR